jgi:hypothetical protein
VANSDLESIAEADSKRYVKCVKEIFFDFVPNQPDFFSLDIPLLSRPVGKSDFKKSELDFIKRSENSLFSFFLAHKVIP